ncbi:MAG: pyrophosphatase [Phycisphaerales bacterium]|nr:pyrophosphatase [Phycisphaerales bacterium]
MVHRVRAAGLLVEHDRILLVGEGTLPSGERYFIPPGGGLELTDRSLVDCLQRELWEEVGIRVDVGDVVYAKEYVSRQTDTHHVELFFRVTRQAEPAPGIPTPDRPSTWFTLEALQDVPVFPPELKDGLWLQTDVSAPRRYLGRTES